jgi:uncharacterized protein YqgV (UPF0045/DUF77 family)
MKVTIELSKYPLSEEYIPKIKNFIERLNEHSELTVQTNATSTHVMGDFDVVMPILNQEIKTSFEKYGKAIFVMKVLLGDLISK